MTVFAQHESVDITFDVRLETTRFLFKQVEQVINLPDGKMFVIGTFNRFNGQAVGGFIRLNADLSLDTTFRNSLYSETSPNIGVPHSLPDGKFILTGRPKFADGTQHPQRFARMNSDGTIDPSYAPAVAGGFFQSALDHAGRLVVTGSFSVVRDGQTVQEQIVRFNQDGSLDTTFDAGTYPSIQGAFTLWNDKIVFADLDGQDIRVNRLNADGTPDQSFTPKRLPGHWPRQMFALGDGKILVQTIYTVIRLNEDASLDTGFQLPADVAFTSSKPLKLMPDGRITLAYAVTNPSGLRIVRLLPTGLYDPSFTPYAYLGAEFDGFTVQDDGGVVIGDTSSNSDSNRFMRLTPSGAVDTLFNVGGTGFLSAVAGKVRAIHVMPDQTIMIGGDFQRVNSVDRNRIARLNADGSLDSSFQITSGSSGNVFEQVKDIYGIIHQPDGKLLINGNFNYRINGISKSNVVRLNQDGSIDPSFIPEVVINDWFEVVSWGKHKLSLDAAGRITVGTSYSPLYDASRVPLRFLSNGIRDTSFISTVFSPEGEATIFDIATQPDGKILISGRKSEGSGTALGYITRLNLNGSVDTSFAPYEPASGDVYAFKLMDDGRIAIVSRTNTSSSLRRLNANGTIDPTFSSGSGANGRINSIEALGNGKLLIGGLFTSYNGAPRRNFAVLDPNGNLDPLVLDVNNEVLTIALEGEDRVLLGGSFTAISFTSHQFARSYLARVRVDAGGIAVRTLFDYDGDGRSDLSIRRPTDDIWYLLQSNTGYTGKGWGVDGDKPAPADYDGDGKTDIAIFRPSEGRWYIVMSQSGSFQVVNWGQAGDLPVPMDRDNDGRADLVLFRESNTTWYARSVMAGPLSSTVFGAAGDKPVRGDFDADGVGDIAVYRPSNNNWYILKSSVGFFVQTWGEAGDIPVPADYDGDGSTDLAIFRPSTGQWYLNQSSAGFSVINWGEAADIPVPADYDGDGKADPSAFRPSNGTWYMRQSTAGFVVRQFGQAGDVPTPSSFIY